MRFVDFAIDLAAVLSASRSVAAKHVALRGRQLDRYGKSSSIAAALRQRQRDDPRAATKTTDATPREQKAGEAETAGSTITTESDPAHSASVANDAAVKDLHRSAVEQRTRANDSGFVPAPWATPAPSAVLRELAQQQTRHEAEDIGPRRPEAVQEIISQKPSSGTGQDNRRHASGAQTVVGEELEDESIPEGVDINIFRTGRGATMAPSSGNGSEQKGTLDRRPSGVNVNAFRTGHGSSLLQEREEDPVQPTPTIVDPVALRERVESVMKEAETLASHTQRSLTPETPPDTEKIIQETAQPPATSPPQAPVVENALRNEDPISTQDASAIGEMLGASATQTPSYQLRESKVPSSRLSRIWNYSGLAVGMFGGALSESISRGFGGGGQGSVMLSPANMERLVAKLSKMRGAALKLGQMMSFQDSKMLPGPIQEVLQRVQDRADYMPAWQRDRVLAANLGNDWRELFDKFEEKPIAAASIGQVHRATLKSNGAEVAVKIQFPGVADSINSDLDNLGMLLSATKLLPKGLYLNKTIDNSRLELGWECDYEREAECGKRYRELLADEQDVFLVPHVYLEASGKHVITMEFMEGIGVTRVKSFTQEQRDWIGTQILRLCLREITEFKFMQTDPNWTNFLYNAEKNKLELLDFGASREYPDRFITLYVQLLMAASKLDRDGVKRLSEELGYLTGHESRTMLDAHIASVLTLAEPFLDSAPEVYDFRDQTITERVKAQIPVMIRERLAPPPEETYSLHRKLSGAFLLCARLGSRVRCRELFEKSLQRGGFMEKAA